MKPDYRPLKIINGRINQAGKIDGLLMPSAPIKATICRWPEWDTLPPPGRGRKLRGVVAS